MSTGASNYQPRMTQAWFATTHWSVVLHASEKTCPGSAEALSSLCRVYWYPLYAFVCRQVYSEDEAGDLTQGFFARLLEKDWLTKIMHREGRFRNFLMVAMKSS